MIAGLALAPVLARRALAFLMGVPWQVWAAVALLAVGWYYGHTRYNAGIAHCRAEQAAADRKLEKAEKGRDEKAGDIAQDTRTKAAEAVAKTEDDTHAREAEIARASVTGACRFPVGLPDLTPAIEAANAANR